MKFKCCGHKLLAEQNSLPLSPVHFGLLVHDVCLYKRLWVRWSFIKLLWFSRSPKSGQFWYSYKQKLYIRVPFKTTLRHDSHGRSAFTTDGRRTWRLEQSVTRSDTWIVRLFDWPMLPLLLGKLDCSQLSNASYASKAMQGAKNSIWQCKTSSRWKRIGNKPVRHLKCVHVHRV